MKTGGWRLGRLFGIDVKIHYTFALLLAAIGAVHLFRGGVGAAASGVAFVAALFGSVLLHELGHALAARRFGVQTRDITLLPIGGVAQLERMPTRPAAEAVIAIAGPAVNVAIAAVLGAGVWLAGAAHPLEGVGVATGSFATRLALANLGLAVFNLIPAFPLDGGRVLRALLAWKLPYVSATRIASKIGRGLAVVFGVAGLFGNPMLVLIAVFVWFAAGAERRQVELKSALGDEPAGRLAVGALPTLSAYDRLADAARTFLGTSAVALPVFEGGELVGALHRDDLEGDLARLGPNAFVAHARLTELPGGARLAAALGEPGAGGPARHRGPRGRTRSGVGAHLHRSDPGVRGVRAGGPRVRGGAGAPGQDGGRHRRGVGIESRAPCALPSSRSSVSSSLPPSARARRRPPAPRRWRSFRAGRPASIATRRASKAASPAIAKAKGRRRRRSRSRARRQRSA
ncbi:MAG: site-2 protease family protein [Myxococcales bacterium]